MSETVTIAAAFGFDTDPERDDPQWMLHHHSMAFYALTLDDLGANSSWPHERRCMVSVPKGSNEADSAINNSEIERRNKGLQLPEQEPPWLAELARLQGESE